MKIIPAAPALSARRSLLPALLMLCLVLVANAAPQAGTDGEKQKLSRLFQSHQGLNLRLEAPFTRLLRKRGKDRPYFKATLIYRDAAGEAVRVNLKVRVRGNYRAKKEICRFPPLKLNFKEKKLSGTIFEGEDKLKLVTHCQPTAEYEQYVLLEYINYRVQNLLSDYSLRTRLATVEYYDTARKKVTDTRTGFFIEDIDHMATRVGGVRLQAKRVSMEQYDLDGLHLATIFEYLLGNTDFSATMSAAGEKCCHNIIPLQVGGGPLIPIPYDFDATGMVNPPYVKPPRRLGIRSIRQRLYRGYCQSTEGFIRSFAVFQTHRGAIFDLYKNQPGLTSRTLRRTLSYLEQFYKTISSEDGINREFIKKCRT